MTLDYKILGQKYFGSAVDDTTSINTAVGAYGYYAPTAVNVTKRYSRFIVALSGYGFPTLAYSDDNGLSWKRGIDLPGNIGNFCFGNNNLVLICDDGTTRKIKYSKDGGTSFIDATIVSGSNPTTSYVVFAKNIFITNNLYSYDGIKWNSNTLPFSVNYSPRAFVHDGKSYWFGPYNTRTIYKSTDGLTWTAVTLPGNLKAHLNTEYTLVSGAISGTHYLFAFNDGMIHYSTDFGTTWTQKYWQSPSGLDNPLFAYFAGDKFIALTQYYFLDSGSNPISSSSSAIQWTSTAHSSTVQQSLGYALNGVEFVAYNHHDHVVMGLGFIENSSFPNRYRFGIKTSTNFGSSFSSQIDPGNGLFGSSISGFVYINQFENGSDRILANASGVFDSNHTQIAYSDDYGVSWSRTTKPATQHQRLCYGNGTFVAGTTSQVGATSYSGSNTFIISKDGITWRLQTVPYVNGYPIIFSSIKFMDGIFVAHCKEWDTSQNNTSIGNRIYTSKDGAYWSRSALMPYPATISVLSDSKEQSDMVYKYGKLVIIGKRMPNVGDNSPQTKSITSTDDFINFTSSDVSGINGGLVGIAAGNGIFLAVTKVSEDYSNFTINRAYISKDGVNWTESANLQNLGFGSPFVTSVVYAFNNFIIFTRSEMMLISPNGITWTKRTITYPYHINFHQLYTTEDESFVYFMTSSSQANSSHLGDQNPHYFGYMNSLDKINVNTSLSLINVLPKLYDYGTALSFALAKGTGNKIIQVQASIGGQGATGTSEITSPQVVYTVPAGKEAIITSIFATNRDAYPRFMDIAVVPNGESLSLKHHIRWNMMINPEDYKLINTKITMPAQSSLYIFPSTFDKIGSMVFGIELS